MSLLIRPDHARRIDLDGVGPVPRPVDIDQAQTGFKALRTLRIYRFDPPALVRGHAEEDEVFIVILAGQVDLKIGSDRWSQNDKRFTLSAADSPGSVACAAYLPPHAEYELSPRSTADVAYARSLPSTARAPAIFSTALPRGDDSGQVLLDALGYAERLRVRILKFETGDTAADFRPTRHTAASAEAVIHVRTAGTAASTVDTDGTHGEVESWDTLAVRPGDQPILRLAPHSSLISLVVAAA